MCFVFNHTPGKHSQIKIIHRTPCSQSDYYVNVGSIIGESQRLLENLDLIKNQTLTIEDNCPENKFSYFIRMIKGDNVLVPFECAPEIFKLCNDWKTYGILSSLENGVESITDASVIIKCAKYSVECNHITKSFEKILAKKLDILVDNEKLTDIGIPLMAKVLDIKGTSLTAIQGIKIANMFFNRYCLHATELLGHMLFRCISDEEKGNLFKPLHSLLPVSGGRLLESQAIETGNETAVNGSSVDVSLLPEEFYPDIFDAARHGSDESISFLINNNPNIVKSVDRNNETPLHYAVRYGQYNSISLLLDLGADINAANQRGYTPLHFCACTNYVSIAKLLIQRGASVNEVAKDGWTPIFNAAMYAPVPMAKLLIESGAEIYRVDNRGRTPFDLTGSSEMYDYLKPLFEKKQ